jgi:tetratricopeptide (TPR) repeat protein
VWFYPVALALLVGCGGGPSAEEVDRSMREFTLAASLRDEGNVPGALEHLRVSLELHPENARAYLLLGYIHLERNDYPRAEEALRKGVELLGDEPDMAATLAEARNLLGVTLIHQERFDDAIPLLRQSAADMLNHAPWYAWGNLGWAYYEKGEYQQAKEALEQAVRVQPRFCLGHYQLGRTLFAMERFEEAEEALTLALEADERCERFYQDAWALRGETRARLGRRDEAIGDFERCVELGARTEAGESCQRFLQQAAP